MSVFRIEKNQNYTVMSNYHLRDKNLSLKAKGLLSQMLSLPEDWDYTLKGLAKINKESIDAIRSAVCELELAGYILRRQTTDCKGRFAANEYIIYEQPQNRSEQDTESDTYSAAANTKPLLENPTTAELPLPEPPLPENPITDKTISGNPTQLNKDILNTYLQNKENLSYPILSEKYIPEKQQISETMDKMRWDHSSSCLREKIKANIEYDILAQDKSIVCMLDEIVELMTDVMCSSGLTISIAQNSYPAEYVQERFLKIRSQHIQYVIECIRQSDTKIHNIKKYLLAALFNAPLTVESYYTTLVQYDLKH